MTYAYGKNILPMTVGFDRLFSTMEEMDKLFGNTKAPSYPPYSILKLDEYNYEIQIAVAGFSADDIGMRISWYCRKFDPCSLYDSISCSHFDSGSWN